MNPEIPPEPASTSTASASSGHTPLAPTPLSWRLAIGAGIVLLACVAHVADDALGPRGRAAVGVLCFLGIPAMLSANLRAVQWRTLFMGIALQGLLALFVLKFTVPGRDGQPFQPGYELFRAIGQAAAKLLEFSDEGARFVFGKLADREAMDKVFGAKNGFVFAARALPPIIFVSSFFTVLYHFGILQFVVRILARIMMYLMGTSGAETLSAVANVFLGMTEAPLIVKPYVPRMTQSELLALMVGGMATISGGLMAVYISMGADRVAILATSVMAAPCGLYLSKLILPETEVPETLGVVRVKRDKVHRNVIDAAASGASDGLALALNVAAMLIAFLAFLACLDFLLGQFNEGMKALLPEWWPLESLTLKDVFSTVFWPVALLMGVEKGDIVPMADLLGTKLTANEFLAYAKLTAIDPEHGEMFKRGSRSFILATYALTGFANFGSIGIILGGIGAMAPERRSDLARLGLRALLVGFLATLINAAVAAMLL